jgi:glycosyl transferase, family 25
MSSSSGDVNEVFHHKACINLDRDADSWARLQATLTRHDIRGVRRFSAVDGSRLELPATWRHSAGAYGCLLSHLQVVRDARKRGLPSLLILEDDVQFDPSFSEKFPVFMRGVPADWDMVLFGALHREDPVPVAENVVRIRKAYSTYAYVLRDSIFDAFIAANDGSSSQVDVTNGLLQSNHNCYGFAPNLAWVESRYSPVQERMADHWYLRESVVLLGSQMDRILQRTVVIIAHRAPNGSATEGQNVGFLTRFYAELLPGIKTCDVLISSCRMKGPSTGHDASRRAWNTRPMIAPSSSFPTTIFSSMHGASVRISVSANVTTAPQGSRAAWN